MDYFTCHRCKQALAFSNLSRDLEALESGCMLCKDCLALWQVERRAQITAIENNHTPLALKAARSTLTLKKAISHWSLDWQVCMQAFLETISGNKGTLKSYAYVLARFFGNKCLQPNEVTLTDIEEFLSRPLTGKPLLPVSGGTRASRKNAIAAFYRYAYAYGLPSKPENQLLPSSKLHTSSARIKVAKISLLSNPDTSNHWTQCLKDFLHYIYTGYSQSQKTVQIYQLILGQFFVDLHRMPDTFTRTDVERFLESPCQSQNNRGGPPSVSTRNLRLTVLVSFYKYASTYTSSECTEPLLQHLAPCTGIRYGKVSTNPRSLTKEQIERFFASIPKTVIGLRDRSIFLLLFYSGRRREEALRLRWGDLERCTFVENGKRREGYMYRWTGKGMAGEKALREYPEPARLALWRYLEQAGRLEQMQPDSPLFIAVDRTGNSPINSATVAHALKKYCRLAGLEEISLHWWRHTMVTSRLDAGQTPLEIMQITGHRSMSAFYIYTQRLRSPADPGVALLESMFSHL